MSGADGNGSESATGAVGSRRRKLASMLAVVSHRVLSAVLLVMPQGVPLPAALRKELIIELQCVLLAVPHAAHAAELSGTPWELRSGILRVAPGIP